MKWKGKIEELQLILSSAGVRGKWSEDGKGKHIFRGDDDGILNWWPKTGTIQCQGPTESKNKLEKILESPPPKIESDSNQEKISFVPNPARKQIFIVHGHDSTSRDQLELALRRLGLEPFILMNTSGGGKTIIEALEGQIGRDYTSDFGIVLMTPDDFGYSKTDGESKAEPRARQNVVLEAGMLLASLTRERMAIVVKGHIEMPSDLQGIIHLGFNDHIREVIPKLCQRLKEVGFDLNPTQIAAASQ